VELLSALVLAAMIAATGAAPPATYVPPAVEDPRIVAVEPLKTGEVLACRVRTANLPGAKLTSSMKSGLPSAIEMALEVLDPKDRVVIGRRVTFRLAFDLWEETFRVEGGGEERDFTSQDELEAFLAELPRLPVRGCKTRRSIVSRFACAWVWCSIHWLRVSRSDSAIGSRGRTESTLRRRTAATLRDSRSRSRATTVARSS
jgi:hypothetical protein